MPQRLINLIAFLDALPVWIRIPVGLGVGVSIILVLRFMIHTKASANNRGGILLPAVITCGAVVAICQLIKLTIDWGAL